MTKSIAPVWVSSIAFCADPRISLGNICTSYLSPRCSGWVSDCAWDTRIIHLPEETRLHPEADTMTAPATAAIASFFIKTLTISNPSLYLCMSMSAEHVTGFYYIDKIVYNHWIILIFESKLLSYNENCINNNLTNF